MSEALNAPAAPAAAEPAAAPAAAEPAAPAAVVEPAAPAEPAAAEPAAAPGTSLTGGETAAAAAEPEAAPAAEGADAVEYADFQLPEGFALDGDMLEGVKALAKANKLDQTQAQALVDLGVKQANAILQKVTEQATENPVLLANHWGQEWSKQTQADPELGGAKLPDTMALATRVFSTFGSPELGKFLDQTGLTHHPELVRFMHRVGKAVSEDTLVRTQSGAPPAPRPGENTARKLYPGMK